MKIRIIILFFLFLFFSVNKSQSLSGLSGLFNIPSAQLADDGEMLIGVNFIERDHLKYAHGKHDVFTPFITVGFLPWLEVSFRITRQIDANYDSHVMDRMFSAKIRFIEESKFIPVITLGLHNPYSTLQDANHFNSTYLVLSKNLYFNSIVNRLHITAGYGSDFIKAADHQYVGLFGGLSFTFFNTLELMGEYDAERFNAGLRLTLFKHIKLLGGFIDMKHFSGGAAFSIQL